MADTPSHRRLAAVWFADIVGYTAISARDDRAAMALVSLLQQCARRAVGARHGRVVKFLGDGAMAEFGSTDDAVRAALALRTDFESLATRRVAPALLRIGVHAGDVIVSEGDIYGDGVNVASRIQREARPGQIVVSADVRSQLGARPEFVIEDLGERELRGVVAPHHLYAVNAVAEESVEIGAAEMPDAWAIGVLPFVDVSPGHDSEYLSDGITDELIYSLGRVEGLKVASRTSSYAFKGRSAAIPEIADALGVNVVLEGSVRKAGNRVRVTPLLVDATSGYQLWTDTYERDLEDVFELQETFSTAIVDALQMKLGAPARITREHTHDTAAYEAYLKGRYHWNRHSPEDLRQSIEHYEQAIAADPDYALAWAGLADTYSTMGAVFLQPPHEVYPRARDAARKALELDPQLASAQAALAEVQLRYEWDWEAAERGFRRALAIDPENADARGRYANLLRDMGRFDEAIVEVRRAQGMDPHSLPIAAAAAGVFYYARRYEDAIAVCQRALEIDPSFYNASFYLASAHLQKGNVSEAVRHFERVNEMAGVPAAVAGLAVAFAAGNRTEEARAITSDLMAAGDESYGTYAFPIASACVAVGDLDEAFRWFERAVEERTSWMTSLNVEPRFEHLHPDPRFKRLLARVGLRTRGESVPNNLPAQPTSIVGREAEIHAFAAIVCDPGVRIATLVGPGGVGKTRLGVEVAGRVLDRFPDGVWFVPLSGVDQAELLLPTIARTLGLREVGADAHDPLVATLQERRALLVLDGFEHLLAAAPAVADLMAALPELRIVVTSQAALRIRGERAFPVTPLGLPSRTAEESPGEITRYGAVALFLDRMESVRPGAPPGPEELRAIVGICRRTDGLPLAIELAVARLRLMSAPALLDRLQDRFSLLAGGPRDLPERHQTLRAVCDWSYGLLDAREQSTFRRLAVFVGGCGLDAAEWMLEAGRDRSEKEYGSADRRTALDLLASLAEKSLLRQVETGEGLPRFHMLETIRQYGLHLLEDLGEMETARSRELDFFADLAARAEPSLTGPDQAVWLDRLEREHENVTEVIDWALSAGKIEAAVTLGSSLWWFWWLRGHFAEIRKSLESALERGKDLPKALRANLLVASGSLATLDGDTDRAATLYEQAVRLERGRSDQRGTPRALRNFASGLAHLGQYERAIPLYEEALALDRELLDPLGESDALRGLGRMALCMGNLEAAEERYEEALSVARSIGAPQLVAYALSGLGDVELERKQFDVAEARYQEALEACRGIDSRPGVASCLADLAEVAWLSGGLDRAEGLHRDALEIARGLDDRRRVGRSLAGLGACAVDRGEADRGGRLLGAAEGVSGVSGSMLPPYQRKRWDRLVETMVGLVGRVRARRLLEEGRNLSIDSAVELARSHAHAGPPAAGDLGPASAGSGSAGSRRTPDAPGSPSA